MEKMDAEIKAQWVAALRSGDYRQAKGNLRVDTSTGVGYCCLGVLCDLAEKAGVVTFLDLKVIESDDPDENDVRAEAGYVSIGNEDTDYRDNELLPSCVKRWASLNDSNPEVKYDEDGRGYAVREYLSDLNDERNYTFAQIADLVEEQL